MDGQVKSTRKKNQSGQMAIFVALLFQVLFVFFAMVINIGLMVHDKINLQNSVDLAAIYAAQRQAEILNSIAHTNYQIRQSWKLLAWRVRVLGDMGRNSHPSINPASSPTFNRDEMNNYLITVPPTVCIDNPAWVIFNTAGTAQTDNLCKSNIQTVQQPVRSPIIIPLPWVLAVDIYGQRAQQDFQRDCKNVAVLNWYMAAKWLVGYKLDVMNRKQVIRALAENLSQKYFKELSGGNVLDGVRKTLMANLTRSNRESVDADSIEFINSLDGVDRKLWLPEIPVLPVIYYSDMIMDRLTCRATLKPLQTEAGGGLPTQGDVSTADPTDFLKNAISESIDPNALEQSVWGYEKNPWYMAYVGLKVRTKPKQPFSPFGKPVEMVARAFAQPFGGRIGPWLKRQWRPDEAESSGDPVDNLAPERINSTFVNDLKRIIPNYARYPGDKLGLLSNVSLTQLRSAITRTPSLKVALQDYGYVPSNLSDPVNGDVMAWTRAGSGGNPWIRSYEIAGIAPDYFDVMYYSIEPDYYNNYIATAVSRFFGPGFPLRKDLGGRPGPDPYGVLSQVTSAQLVDPSHRYFYQVTKAPDQLLTGWAPQGSVDYTFPSGFASCEQPVGANLLRNQVAVPGSCVVGGRTGYSVKVVSRSYLNSSDLPLGGDGVVGPLINPPPSDF